MLCGLHASGREWNKLTREADEARARMRAEGEAHKRMTASLTEELEEARRTSAQQRSRLAVAEEEGYETVID